MKKVAIFGGLVVFLLALGFFFREQLLLTARDLGTAKAPLAERMALIEKGIVVHLPETGDGPFPVVLQFSGCAGVRAPFHAQWAKVATDAGYAAMIIDSHGPRDISRPDAIETVCTGKKLIGQERAGDVLAAIKIAENIPVLDTDHMVLAGWSHGGWSIMDFLSYRATGKAPSGVKSPDIETPRASGAILFYPYCGVGARSRFSQWGDAPPILTLIAGDDTIVNADECVSLFEKRQNAGASIEMTIYPEAEHAFDDAFIEPEYQHWYSKEDHEDAVERYRAFLVNLLSAE